MFRPLLIPLIALLTTAWTTAHADVPSAVYDRALAASVEVLVDDRLVGSGFTVADDTVVTAAHVVTDGRARIEVRSPTWGRLPAKLTARDIGHDVALLELPRSETPRPHLELATASAPVGRDVYLLGAPLFRHAVLLRAMVARDRPTYEYLHAQQAYVRVLHLSGPSPVGASGGPWLDAEGRVVGLQVGLMQDVGGAPVGIAFMAPIEAVAGLVAERRDAVTSTIRIAVEEFWEQPDAFRRRHPPQLEALVVARVTPGGPAARVGIRARDVITHLDEAPVRLRDDLIGAIRSRKPGQTIAVRILRPGEAPRTVKVALARLKTELSRAGR